MVANIYLKTINNISKENIYMKVTKFLVSVLCFMFIGANMVYAATTYRENGAYANITYNPL